jgi:hypothetical protein
MDHKYEATVFDWDDTLLASTYLSAKGHSLSSDLSDMTIIDREMLKRLEDGVVELLNIALNINDRVYIITNAQKGWVELSSQKYMPKVHDMLNQLTIISARDLYDIETDEHVLWKVNTFNQIFTNQYFSHIISIGDSPHEREAVLKLKEVLQYAKIKSLKLLSVPTLFSLCSQINSLRTGLYTHVHSINDHLDTMIVIQTCQQACEPRQDIVSQ